jgi:hypothetical protein
VGYRYGDEHTGKRMERYRGASRHVFLRAMLLPVRSSCFLLGMKSLKAISIFTNFYGGANASI